MHIGGPAQYESASPRDSGGVVSVIGKPATNGQISFWMSQQVDTPQFPSLEGPAEADVVIVGAGYTGLWTAYYLAEKAPHLSVVVLEAKQVGYGASGRNGGWLTNTVTGGLDHYAASHGEQAARDFQNEMNNTVDEVLGVLGREGIDADAKKGGSLLVARNAAQEARVSRFMSKVSKWPEEGWVQLNRAEVDERIVVNSNRGGVWQPQCARIHPAKLAHGLARVVAGRGVTIYENTPVTEIHPGYVETGVGRVRARHILRATEGFTTTLRGLKRLWLPLNSSMIVTEPLSDAQWADIGWEHADTLEDFSHVYAYSQRTRDGRIAIGGRGTPYHFGSTFDADGLTDESTWSQLTHLLRSWFPGIADVPIAHTWSGVLAVSRNWKATVSYDRNTGLGSAGSYVGTGVTATNLAGRTLADLVAGDDTPITRLPWVGAKTRNWEPEPLRWLGTQAIYGAYRLADKQEFAGRATTSPFAKIADIISGR